MKTKTKTKTKDYKYFGVDIGAYSEGKRVVIVLVGFFVTWTVYSIIQEEVWKVEKFGFPWLLTLLQSCVYTGIARLELYRQGRRPTYVEKLDRHLYLWFSASALILFLQRGLGNLSYGYLDYATKLIIQSSKLLPVMLAGIVILRKSYPLMQYVSVTFLTLGIYFFSVANTLSFAAFPFLAEFFPLPQVAQNLTSSHDDTSGY